EIRMDLAIPFQIDRVSRQYSDRPILRINFRHFAAVAMPASLDGLLRWTWIESDSGQVEEGGRMAASYVVDMDGVIYHGHRLIPGALDFVRRLQEGGHKFLFLTNNSQWTPRDLQHRLERL